MVWHHSLPLMNSFNKTEAAVFSCRLCFLRAFPFISLLLLRMEYISMYLAIKYIYGLHIRSRFCSFMLYFVDNMSKLCAVNSVKGMILILQVKTMYINLERI